MPSQKGVEEDGREGVAPWAGTSNDALRAILELPVNRWQYRDDLGRGWHVGPMAEDWSAVFGLGDEEFVYPADEAGVLMLAVKALVRRVAQLEGRVRELESTGRHG